MGKHVRFVIDEVYEGKELTAAVVWHLGQYNLLPKEIKGERTLKILMNAFRVEEPAHSLNKRLQFLQMLWRWRAAAHQVVPSFVYYLHFYIDLQQGLKILPV